MNAFFAELKHWRVYRLAVSYAAVAWIILQLTIAVREPLGLPTWTLPATIGVLMVGFSAALWIGWLQDHRTVLPDGRTIPRSRRRHFAVALISLLPSALVAAAFLLAHRPAGKNNPSAPGTNAAVPEKSIAVLPFDSQSGETDNAYFPEGIQDEILTDLAKVADLKVIGRRSVQAFQRGGPPNLQEIRRALGVSHVLEGSVERAAGRVRVWVQLVDTGTDRQLWGEHYDENLADIFAIQSRIAEKIVAALKARLSPDEKTAIDDRPTTDPEAFDLYLRAKELLAGFQAEQDYREPLDKAVRLLEAATAKDQGFAQAYCLAARAHDQLYWLDFDHTPVRLAREEAAVDEARRLKPELGEAHLARAMLLYHGSLDYTGARAELVQAERTLPNSPEVLAVTSYVDRRQGRWPDAVRNEKKALTLDPKNSVFLNDLATTYDLLRWYRQEDEVATTALRAVPQQASFFQLYRAEIALESGQLDTCRKMLAELPPDYDSNGATTFTRLMVALYDRQNDAAVQVLAATKLDRFVDFGGTLLPRAWLEALIARASGDEAKARAALLAAHAAVEDYAHGLPEDARTLALLGRIDAALGRRDEALREGRRAVELLPVSVDAMYGPALETSLALIYAWSGKTESALGLLGPLCRNPGGPHYGEMQLDPVWNGLRDDARFRDLVAAMEPK